MVYLFDMVTKKPQSLVKPELENLEKKTKKTLNIE